MPDISTNYPAPGPFSAFVPASGTIAAGRIVRSNGVAGQFVQAQGNSVANASNILGVTTGGSDVICRGGPVSIEFDGTPALGPCYLSSTSGLASSTAHSGTRVPRLLGQVIVVTGATTAVVDFSQDEYRDFTTPVLIQTIAPSVDATYVDTATITPSIWGQVIFDMENLGAAAASVAMRLLPDGVASGMGGGFVGISSPPTWTYDTASGGTAAWAVQPVGSETGSGTLTLRKKRDGRYAFESDYHAEGGTSSRRSSSLIQGSIAAWINTLRLSTGSDLGFRGNVFTCEVFGVVNR